MHQQPSPFTMGFPDRISLALRLSGAMGMATLFLLCADVSLHVVHFAAATAIASYEWRLSDGATRFDGRLEMRPTALDPWGSICSNGFKDNSYGANAACHTLGFAGTVDSYFVSFGGMPALAPIWYDQVTCTSIAANYYMKDCTYPKALSDHACVHGDDSGVRCVPPWGSWGFKLVNTTRPTRGLVLARPNSAYPWGTVHADEFISGSPAGLAMRRAMCSALGFPNVVAPLADKGSRYGFAHSSAPTYLRYSATACLGMSDSTPALTSLKDCSIDGYIEKYTWGADDQLQMMCDELLPVDDVEVSLVGGLTSSSGQIHFRDEAGRGGKTWYWMAAATFLSGSADKESQLTTAGQAMLNAVCRHAGFTTVTNAGFRFFGVYPLSSATRVPGIVQGSCTWAGSVPTAQRKLTGCSFSRVADAGSRFYIPAGVDCFPQTTATLNSWEYRLYKATSSKPSLGIAQMRMSPSHEWGTIFVNETNNFGLWDAFCTAMGYPSGSTSVKRDLSAFTADSTWPEPISEAMMPGGLSAVTCPTSAVTHTSPSTYVRSAINLATQCSYAPRMSTLSVSHRALVVDCDTTMNINNPSQWQVQYTSNSLRFRPNRLSSTPYGNVCTNDTNALVALCRMAGQNSHYATYIQRDRQANVSKYDGPALYFHNMTCPYNVTDLTKCTFNHYQAESCPDNLIAGADCLAIPNDPSLWQLRLTAGDDPTVGRLEVKIAPWVPWGTVCDDSWGSWNTKAVCNQLGFNAPWPLAPRTRLPGRFPRGSSSTTTMPIYLDDMYCQSGMQYFSNCTRYTFINHNCGTSEDIAIECYPPVPDWSKIEFRGVPIDEDYPAYFRIDMRMSSTDEWGSLYTSSSETMANAACRTLGYNPPSSRPARTILYPNNGYISSMRVITSFTSCYYNGNLKTCTYSSADYMADLSSTNAFAVDCDPIYNDPPQWKWRLTGGTAASNGRLELKPLPSAPWGTICNSGFTSYVGSVIAACAAVGFDHNKRRLTAPANSVVPYPKVVTTYPVGTGDIWLSTVQCRNAATTTQDITTCSYVWRLHSCTHGSDVRVDCEQPIIPINEFQFRFVTQTTGITGIGRVEMRPTSSHSWGTIYQSNLANLVVAKAACRSVGFVDRPDYAYRWNTTYRGSGTIYVQNWVCPPNAMHLHNCSFDATLFERTTDHYYDLTVECDYVPPDRPGYEWEFRLTPPSSTVKPHFGRLEMRPSNYTIWGAIKGNVFDNELAVAACRSIGYANPENAQWTTDLTPRLSSGRVWLRDTYCYARPIRYFNNCTDYTWRYWDNKHDQDVWVDCIPHIQTRIVGGPSAARGRVEVKYNNWTGVWGTVCNDNFVRNHFAWQAACRGAGFTNVTSVRYEEWGAGDGPITLDEVTCGKNSWILDDCKYNKILDHNCDHSEDAGVNCYGPPDNHTEWRFRIVGVGSTPQRGRLEMRPNQDYSWGMICPSLFNHSFRAWMIACHTLGLTNATRAIPRYYGAGTGAVLLDHVTCAANASILNDCDTWPMGSYDCEPEDAFGIDCDPPPLNRSAFEFRLESSFVVPNNPLGIQGETMIKGRRVVTAGTLMVRFSDIDTKWGTVCANGDLFHTKKLSAELICRHFGLYNASHNPVMYTRTNASLIAAPEWYPILLSNLTCPYGGSNLRECSHNPIYDHDCDHTQDVHIDCHPMLEMTEEFNTVSTTVSISKSVEGQPTLTTFTQGLTETVTISTTQTVSQSRTVSATQTSSMSLTKVRTDTRTVSVSLTLSSTASGTKSGEKSSSRTRVGSATMTLSATASMSLTRTIRPTTTATVLPTSTFVATLTRTAVGSATRSISSTPTFTVSGSVSSSITRSATISVSASASMTASSSDSPSRSSSGTQSGTMSSTLLSSASESVSASASATFRSSASHSSPVTSSVSATGSASATRVATRSGTVAISSTQSLVNSASQTMSKGTATLRATESSSLIATPSGTVTVSPSVSSTRSLSDTLTAPVSATGGSASASPSASFTSSTTRSESLSGSVSASGTDSVSVSTSASQTTTASESRSPTVSQSVSGSSSASLSQMPSQTVSKSKSSSSTASVSKSSSTSESSSLTSSPPVSESASSSVSESTSASHSIAPSSSISSSSSASLSPSGSQSPSVSTSVSTSMSTSTSPSISASSSASNSQSVLPTASNSTTFSQSPTTSSSVVPTASLTSAASESLSASSSASLSVSPARTGSVTLDLQDPYAGSMLAIRALAVVGTGLSAGFCAFDMYLLGAVFNSPCAAPTDQWHARYMMYVIAPLKDFGGAGMVLGNLGLLCVLVAIHVGVVGALRSKKDFMGACAAVYFPSLSYVAVDLLYTGIAIGGFSLISADASVFEWVVGVIGIVATVAIPSGILVTVLRFMRPPQYEAYDLFDAMPRWRRALCPTVYMSDEEQRRAFNRHASTFTSHRSAMVGVLFTLPTIAVVSALLYLPLGDSSCGARLWIVCVVFAAAAVCVGVFRPHRLLAESVLYCSGLVLLAAVAAVEATQLDGLMDAKVAFVVLIVIVVVLRCVLSAVTMVMEWRVWSHQKPSKEMADLDAEDIISASSDAFSGVGDAVTRTNSQMVVDDDGLDKYSVAEGATEDATNNNFETITFGSGGDRRGAYAVGGGSYSDMGSGGLEEIDATDDHALNARAVLEDDVTCEAVDVEDGGSSHVTHREPSGGAASSPALVVLGEDAGHDGASAFAGDDDDDDSGVFSRPSEDGRARQVGVELDSLPSQSDGGDESDGHDSAMVTITTAILAGIGDGLADDDDAVPASDDEATQSRVSSASDTIALAPIARPDMHTAFNRPSDEVNEFSCSAEENDTDDDDDDDGSFAPDERSPAAGNIVVHNRLGFDDSDSDDFDDLNNGSEYGTNDDAMENDARMEDMGWDDDDDDDLEADLY